MIMLRKNRFQIHESLNLSLTFDSHLVSLFRVLFAKLDLKGHARL